MIINKKGKLFGLVNIVDLFVVILIAALALGGVSKFSKLNSLGLKPQNEATVELLMDEVTKGFVDNVYEGQKLYDSIRGNDFGKVVSFEYKPHMELIVDESGKGEMTEIPNSYDLYLTVEAKGTFDGDGFLIETKRYFIGSETRLKSDVYVSNTDILNIIKK
jgi:hypothetical protein